MASLSGMWFGSMDADTLWLVGGVFGLLSVASLVGWLLGVRTAGGSEATRLTIANLNARLRSWWFIVTACTLALLLGRVGAAVLFGAVSCLALHEFFSAVPVHAANRAFLTWICLAVVPVQYALAVTGGAGLFSVFIPAGVFVLIPIIAAVSGGRENFLERASILQFGLLLCVYSVSHAPALLALPLPNKGPRLLAFFLLIVQLSDVFQYLWGKLLGRHKIAPHLSPNKTWEGFVGGVGTATIVGTALSWATPFSRPQAAGMSLVITLLGFAGGLVMSAIKRGRGIKDYGTLIKGHGGVLDRIDSVCFSAPVFYYLTRFFFT